LILSRDDHLELLHIQAWYFQVRHFACRMARYRGTQCDTARGESFDRVLGVRLGCRSDERRSQSSAGGPRRGISNPPSFPTHPVNPPVAQTALNQSPLPRSSRE
jgi:hypothetical protein